MQPMRKRLLTTAAVLLAGLAGAAPGDAADDYFTDAEIERIRDAQRIERRIPVFLEIAGVRLVRLGIMEGDAEVADSREEGNGLTRTIIRLLDPEAADELDELARQQDEFSNDLSVFTRADLLRGYFQALDEAIDNIDDAYERGRGNVRRPLEDLLEFTEDTIPNLREFSPGNRDEEVALEDALEIAELARDGASEALEVVPRTEER